MPPPSTLRPRGRAPKNAGHRDRPCRDTSLPRNQPRCPGDGSCPRHLRHPRGQLESVGGGFHGGSPQGVRVGFREGVRAGRAFLLCLGTLGLCSQPALSEDETRTRGGGVGLGLECSHRWGAPEISKGREQKRRPSPTCGPSVHWGSPGMGASPGPKSLGACCGFL